jgi:hypothetical protein
LHCLGDRAVRVLVKPTGAPINLLFSFHSPPPPPLILLFNSIYVSL